MGKGDVHPLCPEYSSLSGYVLAVLAVATVVLARWSLGPVLGAHSPYLLFTLPVLLSGWWGGLGPGLLATTLSAGVVPYLFLEPLNTLAIADLASRVGLALFIAIGGLTSVLTDALRQARRRSEAQRERLHTSEERLRLILESAKDFAILALDTERRVTMWSPGAVAVFGYSEAEILGQSGDLIFTPEDRAAGVPAQEVEDARREGRGPDERWHIRKDGTRFFASGVLTPLGPGGACGFVKVLHDLTERKRAEDELRRARDELEERVAERTRELIATLTSLEGEMARRAALARRLATAQEEERRRLSRDLHDTVGQTLTGLSFAAAAGRLEQVKALASTLGRELHEVAVRLRPTALDDLGLEAAARVLCEAWSRQTGVPVEFHADGFDSHRVPAEVETALYRVVQEALTNAAKYAGAKRVSVLIGRRNSEALAVVEDDGVGFDPTEVRAPTPDRHGGLGLAGMRERVALLGGTVEVESEPGHGTTVIARIPVQGPASSGG